MQRRASLVILGLAICTGVWGCANGDREKTQHAPASQPATTAAHETSSVSTTDAIAPAPQSQPTTTVARETSPLRPLDNFHAIEEGRAYRSAQLYPDTLEWVIRNYGIRTVINLRGPNPQMSWYPREKAVCERNTVTQIDIPLSAFNLPPPEHLLTLFDAFKDAHEPILIHCRAGADRTGMASALWRMTMRGEPRQAASAELSLKYGHIQIRHPKMMEMVELFDPRREWVTQDYPRIYAEKKAAADARDEE